MYTEEFYHHGALDIGNPGLFSCPSKLEDWDRENVEGVSWPN